MDKGGRGGEGVDREDHRQGQREKPRPPGKVEGRGRGAAPAEKVIAATAAKAITPCIGASAAGRSAGSGGADIGGS